MKERAKERKIYVNDLEKERIRRIGKVNEDSPIQ